MSPSDRPQPAYSLRILDDLEETDRMVSVPGTCEEVTTRLIRFVRKHNRRPGELLLCCLHIRPSGLTLHWYMSGDEDEARLLELAGRREQALRFLQNGRN